MNTEVILHLKRFTSGRYFSQVLEGRQQFVEMAGNLIPITKSGDQLYVDFKAFRENRLPCTVRIRDLDQDPAARVAFMKEPKVARGEVPQTPICNLNISLPDMSTSSSMEMDGDAALELRKRSSLLKEYGIGKFVCKVIDTRYKTYGSIL